MADHSSTSNSKRSIVKTLRLPVALALGVILAVEGAVWWNSDHLIEEFQLIQRIKKRHLRDNDVTGEIPIVGDSRGMHLVPSVMQEALGTDRPVYNYNWPYHGVDAYYVFIRHYLDRNPDIPVMILNYSSVNLTARPDVIRIDFIPVWFDRARLVLPYTELMKLIAEERSYWHLIAPWLIDTITPPTITYKDWIGFRAKSFLKTGSFYYDDPYNVEFLKQYTETGALKLYYEQTVDMRLYIDEHQAGNGPEHANPNPYAIQRLYETLEPLRERSIPVVFMHSPICQTNADIYVERGIFEAYEAVMKQVAEDFPNVHMVSLRPPVYPDDHFGDVIHMNARGAERHMAEIVEFIREKRHLFAIQPAD